MLNIRVRFLQWRGEYAPQARFIPMWFGLEPGAQSVPEANLGNLRLELTHILIMFQSQAMHHFGYG